jgi:hypothetical protein
MSVDPVCNIPGHITTTSSHQSFGSWPRHDRLLVPHIVLGWDNDADGHVFRLYMGSRATGLRGWYHLGLNCACVGVAVACVIRGAMCLIRRA